MSIDDKVLEKGGFTRRAFLSRAGALAGGTALLSGGMLSSARADTINDEPTAGDYDILRFLAAAEFIEDDLWQQYCEVAVDNKQYSKQLQKIDKALPRYVCDDRDNERSHHEFINAYLVSKGQQPINLDAFRTLPSSQADGAQQIGRLTNLSNLTVDTSWYMRYRGPGSPDSGVNDYPQIALIENQATIPLLAKEKGRDTKNAALSAAFHFATIEQGGASLYASLMQKVTSLDVLLILASIGPVEFYQFAAFHKSLDGMKGNNAKKGGPDIPNLQKADALQQGILPEPANFLMPNKPLCSVLRPSNTSTGGAVAIATGLVKSGLFQGQSDDFLNAVVKMAKAADAAKRQVPTQP